MCIIIAKKAGVSLPTKSDLECSAESNPHGVGIGFWKAGSNEVIIRKDFKDVLCFEEWFRSSIRPEDACIIHFRFATHGLVDEGNRHPFPITRHWQSLRETILSCDKAVAHNGVMSSYKRGDKYSDTQKFVMDILADEAIKNNLTSPTVQKLISHYISTDKLAILSNDGSIIWIGWKVEERDLIFSNSSYSIPKTRYSYGQCRYNSKRFDYGEDDESAKSLMTYCDECQGWKWVTSTWDTVSSKYIRLCKDCRKKLKKKNKELKFDETICVFCDKKIQKKDGYTVNGDDVCPECFEKIKKAVEDSNKKEGSNSLIVKN
jgi:predicted glutamine amidotransferase